jgi:integrase
MPTVKLTAAFVERATLEPGKERTTYWAEGMPGFGLRITKEGHKSYVVQYRAGTGRAGTDRRMTLDGVLKLDDARREARAILGRVAKGEDPLQKRRDEAAKVSGTLKAVNEEHLKREGGMTRDADGKAMFSENRKLRSAPQRLAVFERLIYPDKIASRHVEDIKRSEIKRLLNKIEDERGPQAAQQVLAFLSKLFNWYAAGHDDFQSPIVRGMGRVKPRERAGKRVLSDDEIRDVWAATDTALNSNIDDFQSCFAKLIRVLLLTAVRRTEAARMSWPEIEHLWRNDFEGDVWTCPGSRMKGKVDHAVPLTLAVLDIIGQRPTDAKKRPFVFSTTGGEKPFGGYSKAKRALDKEIAKLRKKDGREPMPPWQLSRDVRRTAKTLMARAGIRPDISERVLAHVIPGVEGIYDRYEYLAEKKDALERLAALVERIVKPARASVLPFSTANAAAAQMS